MVNEFTCGQYSFKFFAKYKYLGLFYTEFMDLNFMSEQVAKSSSKALDSVISKVKKCGGVQHNYFVQAF